MLGLGGDSCDESTSIEVQDRETTNSDYQEFFLTDDGRLKIKGCSNNKVLTNKWLVNGVESCRHGNELVIQNNFEVSRLLCNLMYSNLIQF